MRQWKCYMERSVNLPGERIGGGKWMDRPQHQGIFVERAAHFLLQVHPVLYAENRFLSFNRSTTFRSPFPCRFLSANPVATS